MKIALIAKPGYADSGVGRYVECLVPALKAAGHDVILIYPIVPWPSWLSKAVSKLFGWDLQAFFLNYPIWISYPTAELYHFTSQNLATLLIFHPPDGKVIVTVHDLIPRLLQKDREIRVYRNLFHELFDDIAWHGLQKADQLIAVSEFSSTELLTTLDISPQKIQVVYEGC
jgi:glycosyltransferase involved in cell wall biosynthesis